jgi:two-component system alkaline phosphatase synthesis response regulator PhoP
MARILIVDDDESIRLVLQTYLSADGHTVATAVDGQDALEKVASAAPELILLDVNMPMLSGFEVLKRLKENPDTQKIPVFMLTALKQECNISKGYQLGAEEYISKPSNIEHLKMRINKFLKKGVTVIAAGAKVPGAAGINNIKSRVNVFLVSKGKEPGVDARVAKIVNVELLKEKMNRFLEKK